MIKIRGYVVAFMILAGAVFLRPQEVVEAIVAIVNNDVITLSEYKQQHDAFYQALQMQFQGEEFDMRYAQLKKELLETMITDLLLNQEAKKQSLDVSEQLRMMIDNMKKEYGFESDEQMRRTMQQQGIDFEGWRKQQEQILMRQAVIFTQVGRDIVIDDTEIVNYYRMHSEEFIEPEQFTLKAVTIAEEGKSTETLEAKKAEVDAKIEAGENFGSLASEYSEGPEKDAQGDLGSFDKGEMEQTLEQAVETLEVGGVSSWLNVRGGWYRLQLVDKKPERLKSFEEVRNAIEQKIFEEEQRTKLDAYLEDLKKRSFIKILLPDPLKF